MKQKLLLKIVGLSFFGVIVIGLSSSHRVEAKTDSEVHSKNKKFEEFIKDFDSLNPKTSFPLDFPLEKAHKKSIKKPGLNSQQAQTYLCHLAQFDCEIKEKKYEYFKVFKLEVSPKITALIYQGIGQQEVQDVLGVYDDQGKLLQTLVLSGSYGDFEWGYQSYLEDKNKVFQITRARYVWVEAKEKEFVKEENFVITPEGEIKFVILPL